MKSSEQDSDIALTMGKILGTMVSVLSMLILGLEQQQKRQPPMTTTTTRTKSETNVQTSTLTNNTSPTTTTTTTTMKTMESRFYPSPTNEASKYSYEMFVSIYTPIWIFGFGVVVVSRCYESFGEWSYMGLCLGLALPLLLQPVIYPQIFGSPDSQRPLFQRYSFKANVWIAIYSFIGNYWYTHYFYSVLKAKYSMPAHRFNNVPICLFLATHFYFSTYHFFSNALLRKVVTTYPPGIWRSALFVGVVIVFSYFTAYMETLSISSYPYYDFEDRYFAYTIGSAFYGIYFLVSFPAFFHFDTEIDNGRGISLWDTCVSSCGHGMMILTLLDFVRLYLNIPLIVGK